MTTTVPEAGNRPVHSMDGPATATASSTDGAAPGAARDSGGVVHVLRSHSKLVSAVIFLTVSSTVAASTAFGALGPWAAAELAACGALLVACLYLALVLRRLVDETALARSEAEEQELELTEVAAESRDELSARMDGLVERLESAAVLTAEVRSTGRGLPEGAAERSEDPAVQAEDDGDSDADRVWAEATEPAEAAR